MIQTSQVCWNNQHHECMKPDCDCRCHHTTKTGRVLSSEDLDALAAEAEKGYDIT